MKKVIELDEKCESCDGTGLYIGLAERDGAAVICHKCKGTGKFHFKHEYEEFHGKKDRDGVEWVFEANPGIVVGKKAGVCELEDFGGMPYEDWKNGKSFEIGMEDRKHTCPAWFYQTANYDKKPDWDECQSTISGTFSHCFYFGIKEKCWERFDKENKE